MRTTLLVNQDVALENEADDQNKVHRLLVVVAVVEAVEENVDDHLCSASVLPSEEKTNASEFLALDLDTAVDLERAESDAEVEVGDLRCSFELSLIG
jgi:hypothetical protein